MDIHWEMCSEQSPWEALPFQGCLTRKLPLPYVYVSFLTKLLYFSPWWSIIFFIAVPMWLLNCFKNSNLLSRFEDFYHSLRIINWICLKNFSRRNLKKYCKHIQHCWSKYRNCPSQTFWSIQVSFGNNDFWYF